MTLFFAEGSKTAEISDARLHEIVFQTLQQLEERRGSKYSNVALVPPDFTRFHSCVGCFCAQCKRWLTRLTMDTTCF